MTLFGYSVSCSKVFSSEWGRMLSKFGVVENGHPLDVPNAALGFVFYVVCFVHNWAIFLPTAVRRWMMLFGSLVGVASSVVLGYVLAYIIEDFCIVCVSTYVVNFAIFFAAFAGLHAHREKAKRA